MRLPQRHKRRAQMKICALRLSKNFVFPTICVLTLQNTDVRKFPYGNFLPFKVSKPRYTPPVLMRLHSKRYSMRAAARQCLYRENGLYRQTESADKMSALFSYAFHPVFSCSESRSFSYSSRASVEILCRIRSCVCKYSLRRQRGVHLPASTCASCASD